MVRARSVQTPADAGPLVMTTGSDLPSSVQLPVWLSRAGADVLKTHPIVAVDRRGIGMSGALDCRDLFDRQEMLDQAQFESGDDPVANLGAITMTATTSCTDTIAPGDSAYDNAHAAEDIERLRSTWDVPDDGAAGHRQRRAGGAGLRGSHPNKVARLVLDSAAAAGHRRRGRRPSSASRASRPRSTPWPPSAPPTNCPLGADPKGAVDSLLAAARDGRGPGGASVATVANAISTALAYPRGDRVDATNDLAAAVAAARSGDTNQMTNLITQAETLRQTDGQFVNRCSDALNRPTPDRVRELVVAWGKLYPQFGTVGALDLVKCLNWPSGSAPQDPKNLKIPVLLARRAEQPDRRQRRRGRRRRHRDQRRHRQQAGDVAGHRPRRQHLLALRIAAGDRLPGQRQAAAHRHVLPRLTPAARGRRCTVRWWRHPIHVLSRLPAPHLPAEHRQRCCGRSCGRSRSCRSSTAATSWPPTATSPTTSVRSTAPS